MLEIPDFLGTVRENEPLNRHNTWKVGGTARYLLMPGDITDVKAAVNFAVDNGKEWHVIGNGSNVLFPDTGIDGIVIKMNAGLKEMVCVSHRGENIGVYIGAGVMTGELLSFTERIGASGLEYLAGIPGSFGGVVRMNAGAFGHETMQFLESVHLCLADGRIVTIEKKELQAGYRFLNIPAKSIILGAQLALKAGRRGDIRRNIEEHMAVRREKQPLDKPSCGSVFKNPPGGYAGKIIEELGLKGRRAGGAQISEKHANFIINTGNATAADILSLITLIKETALSQQSVRLEEEVIMMGFSDRRSM